MKLISKRGGKVAGYVDLKPLNGCEWVVEMVWTEPKFRRQGIAKGLLAKACIMADGRGVDLVGVVDSDTPNWTEFLLSLGFKKQWVDFGRYKKRGIVRTAVIAGSSDPL